jgi:hypothetical protein
MHSTVHILAAGYEYWFHKCIYAYGTLKKFQNDGTLIWNGLTYLQVIELIRIKMALMQVPRLHTSIYHQSREILLSIMRTRMFGAEKYHLWVDCLCFGCIDRLQFVSSCCRQ